MKTTTYTMDNEKDASALATYFKECGITASQKGVVVKVSGEEKTLAYLYNKFITIALI